MLNFFKKTLTEEQIKQLDKTVEKFKKNPHQFRFTVIFFLSSIVFGLLSIYLLQQKFALLMQKNGKVEIKEIIKNVPVPPEDVLEPTKEATDEAEVEAKTETSWVFKKNENCNVLLPISPYQSVVNDETSSWISKSESVGEGFGFALLGIFDKRELIGFTSNNEITDAGRLVVYCADNEDNQSPIDLKEMISTKLAEGDEHFEGVSIISSLEKRMWSQDILEITFSGGVLDGQIFYITTTNQHLYLIGKDVTLNDESVKKDVERMVNGLIFLD